MAVLIIRSVVVYFVILFALKALGKRQIGELQPIELILMLIISEVASLYMQSNNAPLLNSLLLIAVLTLMQIIITQINLKSEAFRTFICGKPSLIIKSGVLQEAEMRRQRMNLNDLLEQLRSQGYFDIFEIDYALMETNGELSVLPKAARQPVTMEDLNLNTNGCGPANIIILDGKISLKALADINKNQSWLSNLLRQNHISNARDIFIGSIDNKGKFSYQYKEKALPQEDNK